MKQKQQWYVIAYDIRNPKRLQRVHYFLSKRALALQNSVFMAKKDARALDQLMRGVNQRATAADDVRLYPIPHPGSLWAAGKQVGVLQGMHEAQNAQASPSRIKQLFGTLFGRAA